MTDPCWAKVEDALSAVIADDAALASWEVVTGESTAVATDDGNVLRVMTTSVAFHITPDSSQTEHHQVVEVEATSGTSADGTITRANQAALAAVHAALAADRSLGGMLQDLQEIDLASVPNGKDVGAASLQYRAEFITDRSDWAMIIGATGQLF